MSPTSVSATILTLADGKIANAETASAVMRHVRQNVAPYKRIRRIEFTDLPKTTSGEIRCVALREREQDESGEIEYHDEDVSEMQSRVDCYGR